MRRSMVRRRGRSFFAAGLGRHGPYAVGTYHVRGVGTVKATIGTRGFTLGGKRRVGGRKYEAGYNFTTKSPYFGSRRSPRRRRR